MSISIYNPEEILGQFDGREQFAEYVRLVFSENEKINIVSRETSEDDLYKMIADCLFPFSSFSGIRVNSPEAAHALDVGSGGGLPAFPLGIALNNVQFTLIERRQKKAAFLVSAIETLAISGTVIAEDFSESARDGKFATANFDLATLRWVKLNSRILELFARFLAQQGKIIYYSAVPDNLAIDTALWEIQTQEYLLIGDKQKSRTVTILTKK
ncbi:class I SAM-dependent methyltransferase [Gemmatimonas aurantiaca]|nr:class I SAM-dependent methyltransferase [Gemmatimonas aurantiaca]